MEEVGVLKESLPNGHEGYSLKHEVNMEDEKEFEKSKFDYLGIHVEVCQKQFSRAEAPAISEHVKHVLMQNPSMFSFDTIVNRFDDIFLQNNVESICICGSDQNYSNRKTVDLSSVHLHVHVFRLHDDGPAEEELEDEELSAASHWLLPCTDFHGLWESLIYDSSIKSQLLQYVSTTLLFSDHHVDSNIISWNRVILLHGPPGTGKTSLCKALAQKLCIQLSDRYQYGQLVEINTHSLFSKWFSESGKLVMKMFQRIQELIDDKDSLVCVLIDEVESLSAARKASLNSSEPSDAIRVVNALLTQLDQIKKYPNVVILTTSNITGAIDLAFVDRADIKQYIGPPSPTAIYKIYQSCLQELMKTGIITPKQNICELRELEAQLTVRYVTADTSSVRLKQIAIKSEGLSGRTLRKLPFIAHALYIQAPHVTLALFLDALEKAMEKQFQERDDLTKD